MRKMPNQSRSQHRQRSRLRMPQCSTAMKIEEDGVAREPNELVRQRGTLAPLNVPFCCAESAWDIIRAMPRVRPIQPRPLERFKTWLPSGKSKPQKLYVVHGEHRPEDLNLPLVCVGLRQHLKCARLPHDFSSRVRARHCSPLLIRVTRSSTCCDRRCWRQPAQKALCLRSMTTSRSASVFSFRGVLCGVVGYGSHC